MGTPATVAESGSGLGDSSGDSGVVGCDFRGRGNAAKRIPRIRAPVPRMDEIVMVMWMVVDEPASEREGAAGDAGRERKPIHAILRENGLECFGVIRRDHSPEWYEVPDAVRAGRVSREWRCECRDPKLVGPCRSCSDRDAVGVH